MAHRVVLIGSLALVGCFDEFGAYGAGGASAGGGITDQDPTSSVLASGSGGEAPEPAEDCSNGLDDDADELVDCEDHGECGGYMCVPAPTDPGLTGDILLLLDLAAGEACNPAFPTPGPSGYRVIDAPSPCACDCGAPTGQACTASVSLYDTSNCSGSPVVSSVAAAACTAGLGSATSAKLTSTPSGGTCQPIALPDVAPTIEPIATCAVKRGGGCESGFMCMRPALAHSGGPRTCLAKPGDVACADPTFSTKVLVFAEEPVDNRTCSGNCACGAPQGASCTGTASAHDTACGGASLAELTPGCSVLSTPTSSTAVDADFTVSSQGTCAITHQTESGSLQGGAVTTLCCASSL